MAEKHKIVAEVILNRKDIVFHISNDSYVPARQQLEAFKTSVAAHQHHEAIFVNYIEIMIPYAVLFDLQEDVDINEFILKNHTITQVDECRKITRILNARRLL